ncbi:MAG: hypothetical protein A2V66_07690, partial [Ignavibacteria bacterium RBG_13_36_8]
FINIFGLAMGLTVSILIMLWVQDELSYDKYHEKAENIYLSWLVVAQNDDPSQFGDQPTTSHELIKALDERFPEVENSARFFGLGDRVFRYNSKMIVENQGWAADPAVFDIFTYPIVTGDNSTPLADPHSIVLSEDMAQKYFANENPIGKVIRFDNQLDLRVTAVMKNVPFNSYLQIDYLIPMASVNEIGIPLTYNGRYFSNCTFFTFSLMKNNLDVDEFNAKYTKELTFDTGTVHGYYKLMPLLDVYRYSQYEGDDIYFIFSFVAFLILLLACINFVNLSTARATLRLKEVSVRKVVGAGRIQLIYQFLGETIFLSLLSLIFTVVLVSLLLPEFNLLLSKQIVINYFDPLNIFVLLGIVIFTGIAAGLYPALIISKFNPAQTMQSGNAMKNKKFNLRKALVVLQFALSTIFLISTTVLSSQIYYMSNKDLGFEKEDVYFVRLNGEVRNRIKLVKQKLLSNPNIISVTSSYHLPTRIDGGSFMQWGREDLGSRWIVQTFVDSDFLKTLNLELKEGRFFSPEFTADAEQSILINERAAADLGPDFKVGDKFFYEMEFYTVIGIVKDFHHRSLAGNIAPILFSFEEESNDFIITKIKSNQNSPEQTKETIEFIDATVNEFSPDFPLDVVYLKTLETQVDIIFNRAQKLILAATLLALVISSLGLFGLSVYLSERKRKEIAIRKVFGSSTKNALLLLSKEFIILIAISLALAIPVAYYIMSDFLEGYPYRIELSTWMFAGNALLVIVIALLTVLYQSLKTANTNPVDVIKYE